MFRLTRVPNQGSGSGGGSGGGSSSNDLRKVSPTKPLPLEVKSSESSKRVELRRQLSEKNTSEKMKPKTNWQQYWHISGQSFAFYYHLLMERKKLTLERQLWFELIRSKKQYFYIREYCLFGNYIILLRDPSIIKTILDDTRGLNFAEVPTPFPMWQQSIQNSGDCPMRWEQPKKTLLGYMSRELPKRVPEVVAAFLAEANEWSRLGRKINLHEAIFRTLFHVQIRILFGCDVQEFDAEYSAAPFSDVVDRYVNNLSINDNEILSCNEKEFEWMFKQTEAWLDNAPDVSVGGMLRKMMLDENVGFDRKMALDNVRMLTMALTPTYGIYWTIFHLLQHQEELEKAVADTSDRYLGMCCKEAMRLNPPVPTMVPRIALQNIQVNELYLPKGSRIIFGGNWCTRDHNFIPSRWEESFTGNLKDFSFDANGNPYFPFGGGRHHCLGRFYASKVVPAVVGLLIRSKYLHIAEEDRQNIYAPDCTQLQKSPSFGGYFRPVRDLLVSATDRVNIAGDVVVAVEIVAAVAEEGEGEVDVGEEVEAGAGAGAVQSGEPLAMREGGCPYEHR
jgi:cytochrome P450